MRAWTSLFYALLALVTGVFYFTVTVTGLSLSAGLAVLIIGIPVFLLFIGFTRVLALAEGRLVEACWASACRAGPLPEQGHAGPAAHQGDAGRPPHLDHAALLPADAAAGHHLLHRGESRACPSAWPSSSGPSRPG
jgi:hypothetical protein